MNEHFAGEKPAASYQPVGARVLCLDASSGRMENNPQMNGYKPAIVLSETPNRSLRPNGHCTAVRGELWHSA